ncbi:MAG: hypothetical protein AAGE86_10155 [Pseudomonadota bacterium]
MAHVFVDLPENDPYDTVVLRNRSGKKIRQVLWGDWLTLAEPDDLEDGMVNSDKWLWVRWAWSHPDPDKRLLLKVERRFTRPDRPLEIVFVDVGIGDGAVLITPERDTSDTAQDNGTEERVIVIDAGKQAHMREFLDDRFKAYGSGFAFHAAIITHPDSDHYYGFNKILSTSKITFDRLYHNGIVELNSDDTFARLGGRAPGPDGLTSYLEQVVASDAEMRSLFDPSIINRTNWFANVIEKGIQKANVDEFVTLGVNFGEAEDDRYWLPGFAPSSGRDYTIEVLGPWFEYPNDPARPQLRTFADDVGKTKNGHSVLLRLQYGVFSVLFGGDLNKPAEMFLLRQYADLESWPSTAAGRVAMVEKASQRFSADVMKTCHHGSSDVTDEFLQAVNPAAFVISSGDQDNNFVHPRPDLLGRLGKFGKGEAPVLLSTELQRSTRDIDNTDDVRKLKKQVEDLVGEARDEAGDAAAVEAQDEELTDLLGRLSKLALPSVAVDGAIYVKTDGKRMMTAFKKETTSKTSRWFYYVYELEGDGDLKLVQRESSH